MRMRMRAAAAAFKTMHVFSEGRHSVASSSGIISRRLGRIGNRLVIDALGAVVNG
jgi:hypothetical protein